MENFVEKINFSVIGNWHFDLLFWPNMSASIPAVGVCHSSSCNRPNLLTFYPSLSILLPCQIFILHFARFVYFSCQISGTFCCFVWIFLNFVLAFHFYFSLYPLFYFSCPIQNLNTFPTVQQLPNQTKSNFSSWWHDIVFFYPETTTGSHFKEAESLYFTFQSHRFSSKWF